MKKIVVFVLSVIMCFAAAACHSNNPSSTVVESITITNGESLTATEGDAPVQLNVKIKYADEAETTATSTDVTFSSDNHGVATVNASGLITIVSHGTASITVESKNKDADNNKLTKTISLTVNPAVHQGTVVESLSIINGESLTATKGCDPIQLSVKIKYAGIAEKTATSTDITFSSANQSVATVNSAGIITIKDIGSAEIYADSVYNNALGGKVRKTVSLSVQPAVESLTVTNGESLIGTKGGNPIQLDVKIKYSDEAEKTATSTDVTFSSADTNIATVNASGLITIVNDGSTSIYVDSIKKKVNEQAIRVTLSLTVNAAPVVESLTASTTAYEVSWGLNDKLEVSDTSQIELSIKYAGEAARAATSADVTFGSSNSAVASVDANGLITFNSVGTCTITATSKDEKQGGGAMTETINIEVKRPTAAPNLIVLSVERAPLIEGGECAKFKFKNTSASAITVSVYVLVYCLDADGKVLERLVFLTNIYESSWSLSANGESLEKYDLDYKDYPDGAVEFMVIDHKNNLQDLIG